MTSAVSGNSRIFYRGPSQLDGVGVLGIITGLTTPSSNPKTGDMPQTYILREDMPPPEAARTGADRSISGDCALRGDGNNIGRACYVQTKWAPLAVWKVVRPLVRGRALDRDEDARCDREEAIIHAKRDRPVLPFEDEVGPP